MLTKEEKKEKLKLEKNLKYKKALLSQLRVFKDDESYFSLYEPYEFAYSDYLIRLFKFSPPEEFRPSTQLIIPSSLVHGESIATEHIYNDVILPIAKIIKVGEGVQDKDKYKAGELVLLPTNKVLGYDWNPQFIHAHQFSQSNMSLLGDIEQKLPRLEIEYKIYQFTRLGNIFADDEDKLTYLIPSPEIKGKYNLD